MKKHTQAPRLTQIAALLATSSFAAMLAGPAHAQQAADQGADALKLERVVVTGTSQAKSKMRSSVSVTDLDQEAIQNLGARSESEILMLIPGIRTDAVAGEGGNANITVRGIPVASGGSKYVQLQEDGLPTVQFGDMMFGNNDYWTRFDSTVDNIQTLRGGSAAVFASHAPGAVINYISKTGTLPGGSIGLSRGLNFDQTRIDGEYGNKLAPDLRFHIGGYVRQGDGLRHVAGEHEGYQLKGNITKTFNGDEGYFRAYFKLRDENAPTFPGGHPLIAQVSGDTITGFRNVPGYDAGRDSQYSKYNQLLAGFNPVTQQREDVNLSSGITAKSKAVGFEFHNNVDGFVFDDKFRKVEQSGSFNAQFYGMNTLAGALGNAAYAKYANGPKTGQVVTDANLALGLVSTNGAAHVKTDAMGGLYNDLSVSRQFKLDAATVEAKAGYYFGRQDVKQTWMIDSRLVEMAPNGAIIDLFDASGNALTTMGMSNYNGAWGGVSARYEDSHFTTTAPYFSLSGAVGNLDLDAGVRRESFRSKALYASGVERAIDVNGDGQITGAENHVYVTDMANPGLSDYKVSYTNYSVGANYRFTKDLSAFVRTSKGNRAIADRLLWSANIDPKTGALLSNQAAVAPVKQHEVGVKFRSNTDWGNYGVFFTAFQSTTDEFDFDPTRPNKAEWLKQAAYKATGFELEGAVGFGDFTLNGSLVMDNEKVTADSSNPGNVGKVGGGVPKWRWNLIPQYSFGKATFGAAIRGMGQVYANNDNVTKIDGHTIVNAFVNYEVAHNLTVSLNINNLFDKLAAAGGIDQGGAIANGQRVSTVAEPGRTAMMSLRYKF